ncbi:MAG TPA: hypothetical protein VHY79_05305, partial [Rhizomicrobium sp.]|nr:hypothetical protein [Rhizomicrobium sp.]
MKACNGSIAAQVVNNPGAQITNQPSLINDQLTFNYTSNGWRAKAFMVIPAISNDDKKAKKSNIYKITSANENIIIDRKEVDKGVDVQVIPLQFTTVNTPPFGNTEAIMVGNSAIKYAIALPQKPGGLSVQSVANFVGEVGGDIPLIVTTGNESASHIELVRGTIQEKNTGSILTYKTLCDDSGSRCGSAINIPPNTTAKLRMVGVAPSGQYKGVIVITSREVRAGNSVDATIDLSAIENKIVGFVFILFGVLISTIGVS